MLSEITELNGPSYAVHPGTKYVAEDDVVIESSVPQLTIPPLQESPAYTTKQYFRKIYRYLAPPQFHESFSMEFRRRRKRVPLHVVPLNSLLPMEDEGRQRKQVKCNLSKRELDDSPLTSQEKEQLRIFHEKLNRI